MVLRNAASARRRSGMVGDRRLAVVDDDRDRHRRGGARDAQDFAAGAVLADDERVRRSDRRTGCRVLASMTAT